MTIALLKSPTRIILTLFGLSIFVVVITYLFILLPMREADQQVTAENLQVTQKSVTENLDRHLLELANYIEVKARAPEILLPVAQKLSSELQLQLETIVTGNSDIEAGFYTDLTGTTMELFPDDPNVTKKNFSFRQWFKAVSTENKTIVSEVYHTAVFPHPQVLAISTPVKNQDQKTLAYLTILIEATTITSWIKASLPAKDLTISIFDQSGNLISLNHNSSKLIQNFTSNQALRLAQQKNSEVFEAIDPVSGSKSLLAHATIPRLKGDVVVSQPTSEVFARYYSGRKTLGIVALSFFMFLLLLASFLMSSKKKIRPKKV